MGLCLSSHQPDAWPQRKHGDITVLRPDFSWWSPDARECMLACMSWPQCQLIHAETPIMASPTFAGADDDGHRVGGHLGMTGVGLPNSWCPCMSWQGFMPAQDEHQRLPFGSQILSMVRHRPRTSASKTGHSASLALPANQVLFYERWWRLDDPPLGWRLILPIKPALL